MPPAPMVRKGARVDINVAREPVQALHVRIALLPGDNVLRRAYTLVLAWERRTWDEVRSWPPTSACRST